MGTWCLVCLDCTRTFSSHNLTHIYSQNHGGTLAMLVTCNHLLKIQKKILIVPPVLWQVLTVIFFALTFYTSISVVFPLHPPLRSASLLKAISQSCRFTEGFPHIQTAMSQMDAAFMQIWKGPNSWCCWGWKLLVDFRRMWPLGERSRSPASWPMFYHLLHRCLLFTSHPGLTRCQTVMWYLLLNGFQCTL